MRGKANTSKIIIQGDTVIKEVIPGKVIDSQSGSKTDEFDLIGRETLWIMRLECTGIVPKFLSMVSEHVFEMENAGEILTCENLPRNYREQAENILRILAENNCSHNDIRPDNICVKDGIMRLIDFQWATELDDPIPSHWPKKIGSSFRLGIHDFDDRYSLYKSIDACNHLTWMCEKIKNQEPYAFSRFGDGEWYAILGRKGANCDGHNYYPGLGSRLKKILKSRPAYYLGMQHRALRALRNEIKSYLELPWMRADVLHYASLNGDLYRFFDVLTNKTVIIVGPAYLAKIKHIRYTDFLEIPLKNCWLQYEEIKARLFKYLSVYNKKGTVFLFCASMMSNVLIDDVYQAFGNHYILIDAGSVLDPYAGKLTRKYHKTLKV